MFDVTDLNVRYRERAELTARINATGYQEGPKSLPLRRLRVTLAALLVLLGRWVAPAPAIDPTLDSPAVGRLRL